jgi:hypothetical protein
MDHCHTSIEVCAPPFFFDACVYTGAVSTCLQTVVCLHKFHPNILKRYNGIASPSMFLYIYSRVMRMLGGTENVMANYFHVSLKNSTR